MNRLFRTTLVLIAVLTAGNAAAQYEPAGCTTGAEEQLAQLVNDYRAGNGLPEVPLSRVLVEVSQWHVADHNYATEVTGDYGTDPNCNLHTWYGIPGAPYTTCCYTSDHAQAACMWGKPAEISGGSYTATGFELAAAGYETVEEALVAWQNSPGHNNVILNLDIWATYNWQAMGVGVDTTNNRYFLWFAQAIDASGAPESCVAASVTESLPGGLGGGVSFPNPFSSGVSFSYKLQQPSDVKAVVLDAGGRVVRSLGESRLPAGEHDLTWDGTDDRGRALTNGVYFLRVWADGAAVTSKVALLR